MKTLNDLKLFLVCIVLFSCGFNQMFVPKEGEVVAELCMDRIVGEKEHPIKVFSRDYHETHLYYFDTVVPSVFGDIFCASPVKTAEQLDSFHISEQFLDKGKINILVFVRTYRKDGTLTERQQPTIFRQQNSAFRTIVIIGADEDTIPVARPPKIG